MNVAFFGTSDKSLPILNTLKEGFNLSLCITKSDTKVGRKQELKESGVKTWAKENGVDFFCIDSVEDSQKEVIKELKKHNIEVGIVADFSFMIPIEIIETPKHGLINIHFSLLPKLRGASPVQHAILKGLDETGITYYLMNAKMDTGDILHQIKHKLDYTETTDVLYETLFSLASYNLAEVINDYVSGKTKPVEQDHKEATYCSSKTKPKTTYIFKEDAKINWSSDASIIERQIRAYYPWPIAWTTLGELENNLKLASQIELKPSTYKNYRVKILSAKQVNGQIMINNLQVEGKQEVDWMSFVNGYAVRT
ncbi:methionyl-tRNA formyltransferase [Patescibacteria group bacterium]